MMPLSRYFFAGEEITGKRHHWFCPLPGAFFTLAFFGLRFAAGLGSALPSPVCAGLSVVLGVLAFAVAFSAAASSDFWTLSAVTGAGAHFASGTAAFSSPGRTVSALFTRSAQVLQRNQVC